MDEHGWRPCDAYNLQTANEDIFGRSSHINAGCEFPTLAHGCGRSRTYFGHVWTSRYSTCSILQRCGTQLKEQLVMEQVLGRAPELHIGSPTTCRNMCFAWQQAHSSAFKSFVAPTSLRYSGSSDRYLPPARKQLHYLLSLPLNASILMHWAGAVHLCLNGPSSYAMRFVYACYIIC